MAPYQTTMSNLASHFATSKERASILDGLLRYRQDIRVAGVTDGFQWIDGSFVENVEEIRKRAPADVDIVTFGRSPAGLSSVQIAAWMRAYPNLFSSKLSKAQYSCDAFYVDLNKNAAALVSDTRYWFGLFSHQRDSALWKGMIEVPLDSDDDDARQIVVDVLAQP